jgi:hypothetical protein
MPVVFADDPLIGVEVHLVFIAEERDAVLRLFVDLLLRVVGAEVALAAGVGMPRLSR